MSLLPPTTWTEFRPRLWEYEKPVTQYFDRLPPRPTDPLYKEVLCAVKRQFQIPKVKPFHIDDSIRNLELKKMRVFDRNQIKQYVHNLKYRIYNKCSTPCTSLARTTVTKRRKFGLIWGYPAPMTYAEAMFALPLLRGFKRETRLPYGLWIQYSSGNLRKLRAHRRNNKSKWFSLDWSRFDQRIPAWLIRDCFDILWSYVDLSGYEYYGEPKDNDTLPRLMYLIVKYFINTPIKLPSGKVIKKKRGIAFGKILALEL